MGPASVGIIFPSSFVECLPWLKPSDEVKFVARANGSDTLKEKGLGFMELRARVTSRKPNNDIKDIKELTIKSEHIHLA